MKVTDQIVEVYNKMPVGYLPEEAALKTDIPAGGGGVDVTAEVGQTIVVKEVDSNGKPTKWEAVDYQPKTHGKEIAELLPNTQAFFVEEEGMFMVECDFTLTVGNTYTINWNGTPYTCVAFDMDGAGVGNAEAVAGTGDSGEPFFAGVVDGMLFALPLDGSTELVIGVSGEIFKTIDKSYLPSDAVYGYPKYSHSAFDIEQYCYMEAGQVNLFDVTSGFVNTALTREHFKVLEEVFKNQIVFVSSMNAFLKPSINGDAWQMHHEHIRLTLGVVTAARTTMQIRWSDTDNCVQVSVEEMPSYRLQTL